MSFSKCKHTFDISGRLVKKIIQIFEDGLAIKISGETCKGGLVFHVKNSIPMK